MWHSPPLTRGEYFYLSKGARLCLILFFLCRNIHFEVFRAEIFILWCIVHIVHIFRNCAPPPGWMSGVMNVAIYIGGGERRGWWMSGVVNVAFYIGGGECRGWWMSGWWMSHNLVLIIRSSPDKGFRPKFSFDWEGRQCTRGDITPKIYTEQ